MSNKEPATARTSILFEAVAATHPDWRLLQIAWKMDGSSLWHSETDTATAAELGIRIPHPDTSLHNFYATPNTPREPPLSVRSSGFLITEVGDRLEIPAAVTRITWAALS